MAAPFFPSIVGPGRSRAVYRDGVEEAVKVGVAKKRRIGTHIDRPVLFSLVHECRSVVEVSCLDASFMQQLESAVRFGACLIVKDAEKLDVSLASVLERATRRLTSGRLTISLGGSELDLSPSFEMVLTSRRAKVYLQSVLARFVFLQLIFFTCHAWRRFSS